MGLESGRETGRLEMERDVDNKNEKIKYSAKDLLYGC
jgi:hypothetical protein